MPRPQWSAIVRVLQPKPEARPKPPKPTRIWRDGKWVILPALPRVRDDRLG